MYLIVNLLLFKQIRNLFKNFILILSNNPFNHFSFDLYNFLSQLFYFQNFLILIINILFYFNFFLIFLLYL
jgi:hypothetical protein